MLDDKYKFESLKNTFIKLDPNTYRHSCRVYRLAKAFESQKYKDNILSRAGLLHDIGKIYISEANIINKPFALTSLEREIINLHSYIGYKIVEDLGINPAIGKVIHMHHGSNILQGYETYIDFAKEIHTIDAFDAMITNRPYRCKLSAEKALKIMESDPFISSEVIAFLVESDIEQILDEKIDIDNVLHMIYVGAGTI